MTEEELDALDEVYDTMMEVQRNPTGSWQAIQDQADAITTLRAQLAEARAERDEWKKAATARHPNPADHRYWEGRYRDEKDRADRAEAALAAQIEADAETCETSAYTSDGDGYHFAHLIRSQPRDRTALDRMLAEAREKALREAYDSLFKHPGFIHPISGQTFKAVKLEDAAEGILALIEKPNAR